MVNSIEQKAAAAEAYIFLVPILLVKNSFAAMKFCNSVKSDKINAADCCVQIDPVISFAK